MAKGDNGFSKEKRKIWALKITIITFFIALLFSFISDFATNHSSIIVASILLIFLIVISIIFDGIAVAVTACDKAPFTAMAARKVNGSKMALKLLSNANKVANICADVIGDICGIISGACVIVISFRIISFYPSVNAMLLTILFSSTVAALTVGGKAIMKYVSMNSSKEIVLLVSRLLTVFYKESRL